MKAAVLVKVGQPLELMDVAEPSAEPGQAVVDLNAATLNRRDYWITRGQYPGIRCPVVLGSDGAGRVREVGAGVNDTWKGQEVVINPGRNWGNDERVQSDEFQILGMPDNGTFAERVVVQAEQLRPKPEHLSWPEAAALPVAGVTAFRATITQGRAQAGQRVLVTGIGGGVATFALQIARAVGARVFVTSSSPRKIEAACEQGAVAGYDYRDEAWAEQLCRDHGRMDLIVDGAGGAGYGALISAAAPGGTIVNYGSTRGRPPKLDLFKVFWKQLRLQGTTMGPPDDFDRMLDFVAVKRLRPIIDAVSPLAQVNEALARMHDSSQFGKIALSTGS